MEISTGLGYQGKYQNQGSLTFRIMSSFFNSCKLISFFWFYSKVGFVLCFYIFLFILSPSLPRCEEASSSLTTNSLSGSTSFF